MYSMNPGLSGQLADDHLAELRRSVAGRDAGRSAATRTARRGCLRRRTGWFLVGLGLRLVLPPRSAPAMRAAR
jgi:hypothetical protein